MVVNDDVMGGRSLGTVAEEGERLVFSGSLNTNGGGFASIRSRSINASLMHAGGLALRVRGDGRRYACDLRETPRIRGWGATWKAEFDTQQGAIIDVRLPFSDFVPTWRGRVLAKEELESEGSFQETAGSIGFTIADGIDGPFRLDVLGIAAF